MRCASREGVTCTTSCGRASGPSSSPLLRGASLGVPREEFPHEVGRRDLGGGRVDVAEANAFLSAGPRVALAFDRVELDGGSLGAGEGRVDDASRVPALGGRAAAIALLPGVDRELHAVVRAFVAVERGQRLAALEANMLVGRAME